MKLPKSWLCEYMDFNVTPDEFVEKMMWRGFETAEVIHEMSEVSGVVVGKILALSKHPNADKLQVCSIDVGAQEPLTIITGADNVFEGALVPVAMDEAHLVGNITIKPTKMRGVDSYGMLCSGQELGFTEADYEGASIHGIMILHEEYSLGETIQSALGKDDVIFDIELTPNRADCQSIIGLAREAAAALGQKFKEPVIRDISGEGNAGDYAKVTVENTELCSRYCARVVTDLKIEPSPAWLQKRLLSVGLRPINNIVDITNYVLIEYGHPMHAFDLSCVADGHIVVRNAQKDEKVTTLDGKTRETTEDMLLIADPVKGVGIAGVMGGENSEITENTKVTLFESAVFKGSNIRSTTRKLHHSTDASSRFTKGVEARNALLALNRAIELVDELHAGRVVGGLIDVCHADTSEHTVEISVEHVNSILNLSLSAAEMCDLLGTININANVEGDKLMVAIPHYRVDIEDGIEADWDIAEEVGRLYGYYKIKPTLMSGDTFRGRLDESVRFDDTIKDTMAAQGFYEMYNFNFTGPNKLNALMLDENNEKCLAVKLMNPFGEDQSLMRTTLYIGMMDSLARNYSRKTGYCRFFELANVHFDNNADLPEERKMLGVIVSGKDEDFFTLKGSVEGLLEKLNLLDRYTVTAGGGEYFQPGQKAYIMIDGETVGEMGAIHPTVQKSFELPEKTYAAEISVKKLFAHMSGERVYKPIPKYPKVPRDIAILIDESITSAEVIKIIKSAHVKVKLDDVELFDVYRGKGIPEGKKSMAYSFTLSEDDRTLMDEDIQNAMKLVIRSLEARLNAQLRS